jgi:proteasome lid subunit RPN8/RPN11
VKVAAGVLSAIEAHARQAAPEECCGLLLGTAETITEAMRAHNRAADRQRRYEIDPEDHFAAIRRARARGLDVVGAYHSHSRSAPVPSETDRAQAFEDFVFLIVGRTEGMHPRGVGSGRSSASAEASADRRSLVQRRLDRPLTIRAWRLQSGNFAEVALVSDS